MRRWGRIRIQYIFMKNIKDLTKKIIAFRDARDWAQFHTPKDLAISLSLEAGEVMEHFQWKNNKEVKEYIEKHREEIGDELGDVFNYLLLLSDRVGVNILDVAEKKLRKNEKKYPIDKAKGKNTKYNKL